jgi:very-short-patch-repair endonuclease
MTDQDWLIARAQQFRCTLVDAEMIMWNQLRARRLAGHKFRRLHVIGRFIIDFYCAEKRLAVEVDGPTHDVASDAARDRLLRAAGIAVLRIPNEDVYEALDEVLDALVATLEALPSWQRRNGRTRVPRR